MTVKKPFNPLDAVFTPAQVASATLRDVEHTIATARYGVKLGLPGLDGYWAPMLKGKTYTLIGQTSHGKTMLIDFIEHYNASLVKARNKARAEGAQPEIVVHVSVEDLIEEQGVRELGRFSGTDSNAISLGQIVNLDLLRSAASQIADKPIYRIGESLAHPDMMQYLTVSNMLRCLDTLTDGTLIPGFRPQITLLVFDYLQAFPLDTEAMREKFDTQRRLQVRNDMYRLRQAAARYHCPVFVAVQAKQKLDGVVLPLHLPGLYDGEESSSIAQRADGSLSINMPKHNHPINKSLDVEGAFNFKVAENQLVIRVLKQRGRLPSGRIFLAEVNYEDYHIEITRNRWTT